MKRHLLITSLICFGIAFLALSLMAFDDPGARVWTGPELHGEWLLNEDTGEYWYLHNWCEPGELDCVDETDDALVCKHCHEGFDSRPMWYCGDAWFSYVEF